MSHPWNGPQHHSAPASRWPLYTLIVGGAAGLAVIAILAAMLIRAQRDAEPTHVDTPAPTTTAAAPPTTQAPEPAEPAPTSEPIPEPEPFVLPPNNFEPLGDLAAPEFATIAEAPFNQLPTAIACGFPQVSLAWSGFQTEFTRFFDCTMDNAETLAAELGVDFTRAELRFTDGADPDSCQPDVVVAAYCGDWILATGTLFVDATLLHMPQVSAEMIAWEKVLYHYGSTFDVGTEVVTLGETTEVSFRYLLQLDCAVGALTWNSPTSTKDEIRYAAIQAFANATRTGEEPATATIEGRWTMRGLHATTMGDCNVWRSNDVN